MKKILFMVTSMNIGGVEKSLLSLLSTIPKYKYEITLLVLDKSGGFLEYIPDWIKVEEATWFKDIKPIIMQPPQQTIKNYIRNKQYLKVIQFVYVYMIDKYFDNRYIYYSQIFKDIPNNENEYDVAIAYQGPTDAIDYYISHKVKAKKKISWVHFDVSKHSINTKLYNKLYKRFSKVYVVSKEAKRRLDDRIPSVKDKTEVFLNIVSSDLIKDMSNDFIDIDNEFDGTNIVTVGRLSKEKGQDIAIGAMKKLKDDGYKVRLYCVGDGNSRKEYESMIKKCGLEEEFILVGSTPNPYPYMKKADIYVQTSRHEGYCLTLAEAKCLNKPIVTTNFIGAYEQIEDNYNGLIVNSSEDEIYEAIKSLIDNKEKRESIVNNLSKFDLDTTKEINKLFDYIG